MRRWLLIFGTLALVGCSTPVSADDISYTLSEGAIDGPSRIEASGPTTVHAVNAGEWAHTLVITDEEGSVLGATGLVAPGTEATLEVSLNSGTYVFSCRIVSQDDEGNLIDHYELGMNRTVTVIG